MMYGRGDRGETDLLGGERVSKDDPRVEAYGNLDELNSFLGLVRYKVEYDDIARTLRELQNHIFVMGSEIASIGTRVTKGLKVDEKMLRFVEEEVKKYESELPELRSFIIPGGSDVATMLHVARCIARRAERSIVRLSKKYEISKTMLAYVNRLSTLLFLMARVVNARKGIKEEEWKVRKA